MTTKPTIVLVTGATGGIGRETAIALARKGYRVFATGRRQEALDALVAETAGLPLEVVGLDVTDAESIEIARAEIDRRTDGYGIDVLVNNAGYGQLGPVDSIADDLVRRQYETNVFGLLAVTRAFVPAMRKRGSGKVLNVSSIGGRVVFPFMGLYNSTKYAVEALSDAMRNELAPFGVQVVLIEPGYTKTGFTDTSMKTLAESMEGSPYAPFVSEADHVLERFEATASEPAVVVRAIERAITARKARARYVAPGYAWFVVAAFQWLPEAVADWTIRKALGMDRAMRRMGTLTPAAAA